MVLEATVHAQGEVAAVQGADLEGFELHVLPTEIHFEASAGAQAADLSTGPGLGQSGQDIEHWPARGVLFLGLEEQFTEACGVAEVSVDLERRMGVEEVRVNLASKQVANELIRLVGIAQS